MKIKSIEIIDLDQEIDVHDIEVDKDHDFICQDVILHNSRLCQGLHLRKYTLDLKPIGHNISYPVVGGPPFHWNSLVEGTKILTDKGEIPIENIKVGDMVLTHKGRFKRVYCTMSKTVRNEIIRTFITDTNRSLSGTNEHPILTFLDGWKTFENVDIGDGVFNYTKEKHDTDDYTHVKIKDECLLRSSEVCFYFGVPDISGGAIFYEETDSGLYNGILKFQIMFDTGVDSCSDASRMVVYPTVSFAQGVGA